MNCGVCTICYMFTESEAKGIHDIMSYQDVKSTFSGKLAEFITPQHANWLVVWGEEKDHDHVELEFGDQVRLKTRGDCPLIGEDTGILITGEAYW